MVCPFPVPSFFCYPHSAASASFTCLYFTGFLISFYFHHIISSFAFFMILLSVYITHQFSIPTLLPPIGSMPCHLLYVHQTTKKKKKSIYLLSTSHYGLVFFLNHYISKDCTKEVTQYFQCPNCQIDTR